MPNPLALEQAQRQLETDLKAAIARHADGKAHELDLSCGERGTPSIGALSDLPNGVELDVYRLIDAFHEDPVVEDAGLRVGHVTAIDSTAPSRSTGWKTPSPTTPTSTTAATATKRARSTPTPTSPRAAR